MNPEDRPGVRTTEFWLTILAFVLPGLIALFEDFESPWAKAAAVIATAVSGALISLGYSAGRSFLKAQRVRGTKA